MCDISGFGFPDDVTFGKHLLEVAAVAAVPGSSFFSDPGAGSHLIRFCFAKKQETLDAAGERLQRIERFL
jgi:aspartate/methionine/tyrosine aminotransferase